MAASLSVIVCTRNHAETLAETLRCLAAQDVDAARFEVVVVNNLCTDDTSAVVAASRQQLRNLREVQESLPGHAHARACGVRASTGPWIAFVDDDNYLAPDWIGNALRFLETHPACGAFGGQVSVEWAAEPPPAVARRAYAYAATDLPGGTHRLTGDERWLLRGAGLVCRREALVGTGWLRWRVNVGRVGDGSLSGDDTEIVMRIARDGWELWYEPACRLRHGIGARRATIESLRALHRGFALADPLLLGLRDRGTLPRWLGRVALLLARRLYWLGRFAWRGGQDADARLTAQLTLDTLWNNLRGLAAVARLDRTQRRAWLGREEGRVAPSSARPPGGHGAGARPLRVLHLHSGRDYGGLERMLLCLGAERAAAPGLEPVFALGYRHRLARELAAAGARVEHLGAFDRRKPWRGFAVWWRFAALLRRERFGAVVCHGSGSLAFFGWLVRASGVPLIFLMHCDTKVRHLNIVEFLASHTRPALVLCNSAYTAASLPLLFRKPPPHAVLHCPVSLPERTLAGETGLRSRLRAELATPDDAVVVILPSRLEIWKGHGLLLEALGRLQGRPEWVCWIVGGPFDAEQARALESLRASAHALGIAARVRFVGQRADVPALLAAADIFCQPNLTPEPFGVNAVEALYAGLPVVASDCGGTREIVDKTCGRLNAPGDVAALARDLERLIVDADWRRELGRNAPARGRAVSDPARILPALEQHIVALHRSSSLHPELRSPPAVALATSKGLTHG